MSAALLAMAAAPACHLFEDSPAQPTAAIVERFTGSLKQQNSVTFTFTIAQTSTVDVTLTAMTPSTNAAVGLGIGNPGAEGCTLTKSASSVVAGAAAQLSVTESAGSYCVKVYDTGSLSETVTVTVTVGHS